MVVKIVHTNYGIACRIGNEILINKKLKKFNKVLYEKILSHEKAHSSKLTKEDLLLDLYNPYLEGQKIQYLKFIITHPGSLIEFFPVVIYKKRIVINPFLIGLYSIFVFLFFIWRIYG